jgi:hypothetical protein
MEIFVVLFLVATIYLVVNTAYLVGFSPYTQETKLKYYCLGMIFYWPSMFRRLLFQLFTGDPDANIALVMMVCAACYWQASVFIGNSLTVGWVVLVWGVIGFLVKFFLIFEEKPSATRTNGIAETRSRS